MNPPIISYQGRLFLRVSGGILGGWSSTRYPYDFRGTLESTSFPIQCHPVIRSATCHQGHGAIAATGTALGADTRILKASQSTSDLCQDAAGKLTTVTPSHFPTKKMTGPKREKKRHGFGERSKI